jgi:hypothetical protein
MSDWQLADTNTTNGEKSNNIPKSDWTLSDSEPQEGFLKNISRDALIGLTHAGRNLHNLPHDLTQGLENATSGFGNLFGQLPGPKISQGRPISSYLPYDPNNYGNIFGQNGPPTGMHNLIQKGFEYAPEALTAANMIRRAGFLPHLTKRGATKKLNKAQTLAQERDIGKMNVNPELIEDARQFLPDLLQQRNAFNSSHAGDYNSLFNLQSDLGKISHARTGKIRSLFAPEAAIKGQAGLESRGNLLNAIHENLQSQGHHDISNLLRQGQNDYRKYMKFRKYPKMVGGAAAAYAIPKNALTDLIKKLWMHSD